MIAITLIGFILGTASAQDQALVSTQVQSNSETNSTIRPSFGFSLSKTNAYVDSSDETINGDSINLDAGFKYRIRPTFYMKSSLRFSARDLEANDVNELTLYKVTDAASLAVGPVQEFIYHTEFMSRTVEVFGEISLMRVAHDLDLYALTEPQAFNNNTSAEVTYNLREVEFEFGFAAGIRLFTNDSFAFSAKYWRTQSNYFGTKLKSHQFVAGLNYTI